MLITRDVFNKAVKEYKNRLLWYRRLICSGVEFVVRRANEPCVGVGGSHCGVGGADVC